MICTNLLANFQRKERCGIGPKDPRKVQACLQRPEEVIAGYANMQTLRKERMELEEERLALEARLGTVKDVLPLAEQITRLKMDIRELLAFHSAVSLLSDQVRTRLVMCLFLKLKLR
jgi:hypothetical protein